MQFNAFTLLGAYANVLPTYSPFSDQRTIQCNPDEKGSALLVVERGDQTTVMGPIPIGSV